MSVTANSIYGAVVLADGRLRPIMSDDASSADTHPPADKAQPPTPVAMTGGRQISAARGP